MVRRIPKTVNLEKLTELLIKNLCITHHAVMCLYYLIYFIQYFFRFTVVIIVIISIICRVSSNK